MKSFVNSLKFRVEITSVARNLLRKEWKLEKEKSFLQKIDLSRTAYIKIGMNILGLVGHNVNYYSFSIFCVSAFVRKYESPRNCSLILEMLDAIYHLTKQNSSTEEINRFLIRWHNNLYRVFFLYNYLFIRLNFRFFLVFPAQLILYFSAHWTPSP